MPAINKKARLQKAPKPALKKPGKPKLISSQLGVTAVKKPRTKHSFNPGKANRGIVFIKNIPHGFYEEQLKAYFEQFGQVTRTRVARSKRTGKSNGYAFVEFKVPEVGKIAAETMDNYLMFKQNLKTAYIPPEEQKFNYFREVVHTKKDADGVPHLVTPKTLSTEKAIKKINTMPTSKQHENRVERALYKLKKAQEYYTNKNISIDLDHVAQNKAEVSGKAVKTTGKKDQKAKKQASKAKAHDSTLDRLLNETIPEGVDESDESYVVDANDVEDLNTFISKQLTKKTKKSDNNTTLERLLNETIPDGADESDESFAPVESDSDEIVQIESSNKRKKSVESNKANAKKPKSSVSSVEDIQSTSGTKSKKATAVAAGFAHAIIAKKSTVNKKPKKLNTRSNSDDGDDEFTASTSSTALSPISKPSSTTRTTSKKSKKSKVALPSQSLSESSPEVAPNKKKTSTLLVNAGIQKRNKKPVKGDREPKKNQKGAASTKALLLGATKLCNKVDPADLKKKKSGKKNASG